MSTPIHIKNRLINICKHYCYLFPLFSIIILTAFIFSPIFKNGFTNWDEIYITHNPYLKNLTFKNLWFYFTSYYSGNYHPLTLISLAIDYIIGGMQPWYYQLTNLILHLANTMLVFFFIRLLLQLNSNTVKKKNLIPFIAAALFAIHPLQVESVAWISERKNVLYSFFFLLSLIGYTRYISKNKTLSEQTTSYSPSRKLSGLTDWGKMHYIISLFFFILSLLSKGMAVPLSLCIIGIDYFAGRNLLSKIVIIEKIPYLLLSLGFGIIAIFAQQSVDAIRNESSFSYIDRVATTSYGLVLYLAKLSIPWKLSVFYPYPSKTGALLPAQLYLSIGIILILLFLLIRYFRKNRIVVFGTFFFIANISIVLQFIPVGDAVIADRYVYISSIGLFFIIGYAGHKIWENKVVWKSLFIVIALSYCIMLCIKTYNRVRIWKDSYTLWTDAVKKYPENNDRGFQNLGNFWLEKGNYKEAEKNYNQVLQMKLPNKTAYNKAYVGKGQVKSAMNDFQGAMKDYDSALTFFETYEAYFNRGVLKMKLKDTDGALNDYNNAARIEPFRTEAYINKGLLLCETGNYSDALQTYNQVLSLDPQNSNALFIRGQLKQMMNDAQGAMDDFNTSLSIRQSYEGYLNRAVLRIALKDFEGAIADLNLAAEIDPLKPEIYINRGIIEMNFGNTSNALQEFNKAVEINPEDFRTHLYLGYGKIQAADYTGAINDLTISIQQQSNAEAFLYRGIANINNGNKKQGCADLNQAALMGNSQAHAELQKNCR